VCSEDTPDDIFIDVDPERMADLLRDPRGSDSWVTPFQLNDRLNKLPRRILGAWLSVAARRIQQSIFLLPEDVVELQ